MKPHPAVRILRNREWRNSLPYLTKVLYHNLRFLDWPGFEGSTTAANTSKTNSFLLSLVVFVTDVGLVEFWAELMGVLWSENFPRIGF